MSTIHRRECWDIWRHDHKLIQPYKMKTSWGAKNTRADHIQANVNNRSNRICIVISRQLSNVFYAHPYSYTSSALCHSASPHNYTRLDCCTRGSTSSLRASSRGTKCLCGFSTLLFTCSCDYRLLIRKHNMIHSIPAAFSRLKLKLRIVWNFLAKFCFF